MTELNSYPTSLSRLGMKTIREKNKRREQSLGYTSNLEAILL